MCGGRAELAAGPLEDSTDVGVDGQDRPAKGEAGDRVRGVPAHAWKLGEVVRPAVRCDLARSAVQVEGAAVVAEALPLADHVAGRGGRERLDRGPALEESEVARDDARDLRLLGHDLGDEDRVRISGAPPRQVAAVLVEPGEKGRLHRAEPTAAA